MDDENQEPACTHFDSLVVDSRKDENRPERIRRRRKCLACGHRWSTLEVNEEDFIESRNTREKAVVAELMDTLGRYGFILAD
jgi:transcriptional regulator NrdR family protein